MTVRLRPGTPLAARGGLVAAQAWDAAGDVLVATGPDTATALPVGTEGGAAFCADPNATNKVSWSAPQTVEPRYTGATGSLASTYDRAVKVETNQAQISTGRLYLQRILLPKGLLVTSVTFWSMTTAAGTPLNQWFGLFDSSRAKLRLTSDDTSTAWGSNSAKTLNLSSTFTTTYAGWYYVGICVKASTVPSLAGISGLGTANIRVAAPLVAGNSTLSLTDPASCPDPAGAITSVGAMHYAEVS